MKIYETIQQINNKTPKDSRWFVVSFADDRCFNGKLYKFVNSICTCGETRVIRLSSFINGTTKSCGCKKKEDVIKQNTKWVNNSKLIQRRYGSIIRRCYDPNNSHYNSYGAKGVRVCDLWLNDYQSFINWCNVNGLKDGYDIDKDFLGDGYLYSPETCCIIPHSLNASFQPKQKGSKKPRKKIQHG